MIHEAFTPLGGVIAVIYVGTISSILWWMLHIPRVGDVEQHVKRVMREQSRFARILVPVQGDVLSDRLVALGCQMARYRGASMNVLYVIEVPYTLPITAAMQDQERQAHDAFRRAEKIADRYGVTVSKRLERARQVGPGIVQYAAQYDAELLLMADMPKSNRRGTRYARSVEYVFEHASCDVIIHRPHME